MKKHMIKLLMISIVMLPACTLKGCFFDSGGGDGGETILSSLKTHYIMDRDYAISKTGDPIHRDSEEFQKLVCFPEGTMIDLKGRESAVDFSGMIENTNDLNNKEKRKMKSFTRGIQNELTDAFWAGVARNEAVLKKYRRAE